MDEKGVKGRFGLSVPRCVCVHPHHNLVIARFAVHAGREKVKRTKYETKDERLKWRAEPEPSPVCLSASFSFSSAHHTSRQRKSNTHHTARHWLRMSDAAEEASALADATLVRLSVPSTSVFAIDDHGVEHALPARSESGEARKRAVH